MPVDHERIIDLLLSKAPASTMRKDVKAALQKTKYSIPDALKISYTHKDHPGEVFMYKMKDIKYDIQKGWIFLSTRTSEPSGGLELTLGGRNSNNNTPAPSEPHTPLSVAPTPIRPSRAAAKTATSRISASYTYTWGGRPVSRPAMPPCLSDDDISSISAMLDRAWNL